MNQVEKIIVTVGATTVLTLIVIMSILVIAVK